MRSRRSATDPGNFRTVIHPLTWGLLTQSLKERFRLRWSLKSRDFTPSFRLRLSWCAVPEVWPKRVLFHLSNTLRFHIDRAVFYRSPDESKIQRIFPKTSVFNRFFSHPFNSMFIYMLITAESAIYSAFKKHWKKHENAVKIALVHVFFTPVRN